MVYILLFLLLLMPACATTSLAPQPKTYSQGEAVTLGGLQYIVHKSICATDKEILVDVGVTNIGQEAIQFPFKPSFSLVDQNNRRYEHRKFDTSMPLQTLEYKLLQPLNPGVEIRGYITFDVPCSENYRLMVVSPTYAKLKFAGSIDRVGPFAYITLSPVKYQSAKGQTLKINPGTYRSETGRTIISINEKGILNGKFLFRGTVRILSGKIEGDRLRITSIKEDGTGKLETMLKAISLKNNQLVFVDENSGQKTIFIKK